MNKRNFNFKKFNILSSILLHRKESMNILQPTFKSLCRNYGSYRTQCNFRMQIQKYLNDLLNLSKANLNAASILIRLANRKLSYLHIIK